MSVKEIPATVCMKEKNISSNISCVTVGDGTRPASVSGRYAASEHSSGMSDRSHCGSKSRNFSGRSFTGSGFGGSALASGYACSPRVGFGGSSVHFGSFASGFGLCNDVSLLSCNKKLTMQNLNDRLASYLDTVRSLEEENSELDHKIKEWYDQQGALDGRKDYSAYHQQIEDLKNQIICATVDNSKLILDIDNNQITADDFKVKFETELALCQNVEADINGLRQVLDKLTLSKSDLESELDSLHEELCCLKKNHEEEVKSLENQTNGDVSVEVSSAPGQDLKKVLEEMRRDYEAIIENNSREVEQWYESKKEEVHREACNSSKEEEDCSSQLADLKSKMQTLGIELQAQIDLRDTLENSLAEIECRYSNNLAEIQEKISFVEKQLAELRTEIGCQNQEYKDLLDVKSRLEQEIHTYRCLLEGIRHDIGGESSAASRGETSKPAAEGSADKTSHTSTTSSRSHGSLKRVHLIDYEEK